MSAYEAQRQQQIARNKALLRGLGLERAQVAKKPPSKRRKLNDEKRAPTRKSNRIAAAPAQPSYTEETLGISENLRQRHNQSGKLGKQERESDSVDSESPRDDVESLRASWPSWTPIGPPPTRDENGTLRFEDEPTFTPNKTPEEVIREGCFGGTYFRLLYSKTLRTTISDDWRELPPAWTSGLNVSKLLTSERYDPAVNRYRVSCGQSIEEWEAAGWINHQYDVRGWFQWYCRFYQGRRCDDDERQISRWRKCVGETGRWRRTLLKKFLTLGIRNVADEGDESESGAEVSPVVHQTCLHWAWEPRQDALDEFWAQGR